MTEQAPVTLIVEDDDNDLMLLLRTLQKADWPYPKQVVRDGADAEDYIAGRGIYGDRRHFPLPRLVLLDLRMPGRNGGEVLQWIESDPTLKPMLVVVLCGTLPPNQQIDARVTENRMTIVTGAFLKPLTVQSAMALRSRFDKWLDVERGATLG